MSHEFDGDLEDALDGLPTPLWSIFLFPGGDLRAVPVAVEDVAATDWHVLWRAA